MPTPTSLSDYEIAFAAALTDTALDPDARAAYLSMLARDARGALWHDRDAGRTLAQRIEAAIDRSADPLRGLHQLVVLGRVESRAP